MPRIPFAPLPFLPQVVVERVAVDVAVGVALSPRIPVPVPRPAHVGSSLEYPRREPELVAQAVEHIQPREPGPDDYRVEVRGRLRACLFPGFLLHFSHVFLLLIVVNTYPLHWNPTGVSRLASNENYLLAPFAGPSPTSVKYH